MDTQNTQLRRIFSLINTILMFAALALILLGTTEIWEDATYVYMPVISISFFIQTYLNWNTSKKYAIFNLTVAIIGTASCILMLFI